MLKLQPVELLLLASILGGGATGVWVGMTWRAMQ